MNDGRFVWDGYSDQPYPLKDRAYKQQMRRMQAGEYLKTLLTAGLVLPAASILMGFLRGGAIIPKRDFYGMGVNLDKGAGQPELIDELGVRHLLVRLPLWDISRLGAYNTFVRSFGSDKKVALNILQDRPLVEDIPKTQEYLRRIFGEFGDSVEEYQIGNAVNRSKWGFFGMGEYLRWYEAIQELRDREFPSIKLIGPSVIDFEYHFTARALFNGYPIRFDRTSALLYVDRRGAPENSQMGIFDTARKVDLLYALVHLSPQASGQVYITEANWPLSGTTPYAPTSELECVDEVSYALYMRRYHEIVRNSGKIARVYWHQLIAPGYGLVDNRGGKLRLMPAFDTYKRMINEDPC